MNGYPDNLTLAQAKVMLRERAEEKEGTTCPCCGRFTKVYRRRINNRQAMALLTLYRKCGLGWGHVPTLDPLLRGDGGMLSLLRYWNLVEEHPDKREDGGRAGLWKLTELGVRWVTGNATVPKYARIYNAKVIDLEGDPVTIQDALGKGFNLAELMQGV